MYEIHAVYLSNNVIINDEKFKKKESNIWRKKRGDEVFRAPFKFPRKGYNPRHADFDRFSHIETRTCCSWLVSYLQVSIECT